MLRVVVFCICVQSLHSLALRHSSQVVAEAEGSDSFEDELNEQVSDVEEGGVVVHKHLPEAVVEEMSSRDRERFEVENPNDNDPHSLTQLHLQVGQFDAGPKPVEDSYTGNTDKYNKKQPSGSTKSKDKGNTKKKKNNDPSVKPPYSTGFENEDPFGDPNAADDGGLEGSRRSPFKNRNNYTGVFEPQFRRDVPVGVRKGGLLEGEKYDLFNKLMVDDPIFANPKPTSYQVTGRVTTAEGGLDNVQHQQEEPDDPPPRATESAVVTDDKKKPPPPDLDQPEREFAFVPIEPPAMPSLDSIPGDVIPEEYRSAEILREAMPEIILSDGSIAKCGNHSSEEEWHKCIGHVYLQLAANAPHQVQVPCGTGGGESEGGDCAFRDLMVGKIQGYSAGWQTAVKQLIQVYQKAFKQGYTQAYDIAFQEGQQKYLGEQAAGDAVDDGSMPAGAVEKGAGLGNRPSSGGASGPMPITEDQDGVEAVAGDQQKKEEKQAKADAEKKQELKDNYEAANAKNKQDACDRAKKQKTEKEQALDNYNTGPRTFKERAQDDNAPCDTSPAVSTTPKTKKL
eukprot:c9904_g1_i1.p1 GENE.c9904_g1_i1~~c9904_g1_i1.p1  ORF type:complete len:566 (-),score=185.32 c9904_g1_i1:16-1713(-)